MHKIVLEVPGEQELNSVSEKLKENQIRKLSIFFFKLQILRFFVIIITP